MDVIAGFDWDDGNWPKCAKHGLTKAEIESVFHTHPAIHRDPQEQEDRLRAIGIAENGRYVFVVFTLREIDGKTYIRAISARYMHDREIKRYEQS
jgi:uncharacterized DUF497 family protein